MVPGMPGGRADGPSLVDEIHQQRVRAVAERRRKGRRRVWSNLVFGVLLFVGLVAAGVVVKLLVDRHRLDGAVATARTHLAAATPVDLQSAVVQLEQNLHIEPGHPDSLGLLALVRAHQALEGLVEIDVARQAVAAASDADRDAAPVAAGILAAIEGDFDEARRAHEAVDGDARPELANTAAWLQGMVALGRPYEKELTEHALARIEQALQRDPEWIPNLRVAASLLSRDGRLDDALQRIETARAIAPSHVGLSIDEAVCHALQHEHRAGVLEVTEVVLLSPSTPPRDAGYARLARGLALLQGSELVEGVTTLEAAWSTLPRWDNHGRDLVLDALLSASQVDKSKALRADVRLGSQADAIYDAWQQQLDGDAAGALDRLEALPQDLPRVAHLQALALVEQRRWEEAERWVGFALAALPHRPDLAVASARVQAQRGDAKAIERLEALADAHPWAHRVWTGVAEAHAIAADPKAPASKAMLDATERATRDEPRPAEAWYLLGQHHRLSIKKDPKRATEALHAFRKADEAAPKQARYASMFGIQLAEAGRWREAEDALREAIALEHAGSDPFVVLARMVIDRAEFLHAPVPDEVEGWLGEAAARGGDPWVLELEWARLQLARGTSESLPQAQLRAERLLQQYPRHIKGRVLYALALLQQGKLDEAAATLRHGIRRTLRRLDGALYIAMARVELAQGNKRAAAKSARRGWAKLVREPAPAADLLLTAPFVARLWLDVDAPREAVGIAKGLTAAAPFNADAWVFQGNLELAAELDACASASEALELDEELAAAHALLGACLVARRQRGKAKAAYEKAAELAAGTVEAADYRRRAGRL